MENGGGHVAELDSSIDIVNKRGDFEVLPFFEYVAGP